MARFNVTYEIITPDSTEEGEVEDCGFVVENVSLREAFDYVNRTESSQCGGVECIEANDSRVERARWITVYNGMEFRTGARENRSLHIPDTVTGASRARIARLMGAI